MPKKSPNQLFRKLFHRYTFLIICIVIALAAYFVSATRSRILDTNLNYMNMMTEKAAGYLEDSGETVDYIHAELYQSTGIMADLLRYFEDSGEGYQRYRLDAYMASPSDEYEGFDDFAEETLRAHSDILSIELISYSRSEVTTCYPEGKTYIRPNAGQRMKDVESGNLAEKGVFSFVKEIRNPDNLTGVGCMIVNFGTGEFEDLQSFYSIAEMVVLSQNGTVIYQSDEKFKGSLLSKAADENEEQSESKGLGESGTEREMKAYIQKAEMKGYAVYGVLGKQKAAYLPLSVFLTIVGLGAAIILIAILCVRSYLLRLTGRLNGILDGMHRITTGDLTTRIPADRNGDELDVISAHFNEMCQELDRYIQKSYLAEIEQKDAELEALQNQINPHFLYNTLEAIRMKAICNGDREVGKMLYSMSVIFRSQLKDADMITLIQEIHYCKKYLELFEFRYQGRFSSAVECPEELMNYKVMKFILQPVVENYFFHGIKGGQKGNVVHIWVEREAEALLMHVEDNGKGMEPQELAEKNEELLKNETKDKKSVGINNVNRRIRAVYGEGYGVTLKAGESGGLHVIVKVGITEAGTEAGAYTEGGNDEEGHVSGR